MDKDRLENDHFTKTTVKSTSNFLVHEHLGLITLCESYLRSQGFGLISMEWHHGHSSSDPLAHPCGFEDKAEGWIQPGSAAFPIVGVILGAHCKLMPQSLYACANAAALCTRSTLLLLLLQFTPDLYSAFPLRQLQFYPGHPGKKSRLIWNFDNNPEAPGQLQ